MMQRCTISWAIIILAGALAASGQESTFSIASEEVRIDVLVTDKGKPVADLKAADFEIFDNGMAQEIQYITLQKQTPISAILVFDMSYSVAGELLNSLRDAALGFISDLKDGDQAALITFNNAVVLDSPLTHDFAHIKRALDQVKPFRNSSLFDGSYAGLVLAESRPEPPLLIIFGDGRDTSSWLTSETVLEKAKGARRNDTVVYAVSAAPLRKKPFIGSMFETPKRAADDPFLRDLTKFTGGSLIKIESVEDLAAVFRGILEEFRLRYLVTYTPRGVSGAGWHKLDVRVKRRSATVKARTGYMRSSHAE
jgi:Ca-activated chloride channel homolog